MSNANRADPLMGARPTPGPWYADRGKVRNDDQNPPLVADCTSHGDAYRLRHPFGERAGLPSESEANACLIAAAPDLLAALRRLVEVDDDDITLSGDDVRQRLTEARAAIAKAEGLS